jgi:serine/threonine protein kinase
LKHPLSNDEFYPVEYDNVIYDCFQLRVIFDRERTGFEETKEFPIVINSTIAGRYQILEYLGSAAFSKAIQCLDLVTKQMVCMKVIENNKDYYDQSIDEIKLLRYINYNGDVDQRNVLRLYDYFYHKEHLFIVTELLKENLYEYYKLTKEAGKPNYFTIGRLQKVESPCRRC